MNTQNTKKQYKHSIVVVFLKLLEHTMQKRTIHTTHHLNHNTKKSNNPPFLKYSTIRNVIRFKKTLQNQEHTTQQTIQYQTNTHYNTTMHKTHYNTTQCKTTTLQKQKIKHNVFKKTTQYSTQKHNTKKNTQYNHKHNRNTTIVF